MTKAFPSKRRVRKHTIGTPIKSDRAGEQFSSTWMPLLEPAPPPSLGALGALGALGFLTAEVLLVFPAVLEAPCSPSLSTCAADFTFLDLALSRVAEAWDSCAGLFTGDLAGCGVTTPPGVPRGGRASGGNDDPGLLSC